MDSDEETTMLLASSALIVLSAAMLLARRQGRKKRRWRTRPINRDHLEKGFYKAMFLKMKLEDPEQFFKYTRMTVAVFNYFVSKLAAALKRRNISDEVCPEERVAITLQYLSQGVSMQSLAWSYKLGLTTVQQSIHEVCKQIWDIFSPTYLAEPSTEEWRSIAVDFYNFWSFPNCIGALDGKHINIQAPARSRTLFFNYKKNFSIVLMALCDAKYFFKFVDVGAYGSQSDGGVFRNSVFGQRFESNEMNVPAGKCLPNTNIKMPYIIVADEAFPLKRYIISRLKSNHGKKEYLITDCPGPDAS